MVFSKYSFKVLRFQKIIQWELLGSEFESITFGKSYCKNKKVALLSKTSSTFESKDCNYIVSCYNESTNKTKDLKALRIKPLGLVLTKTKNIVTWNYRGDVTVYTQDSQNDFQNIPVYTPIEFPFLLGFFPKIIRVLEPEKLLVACSDTEITLMDYLSRKSHGVMQTTCIISAMEIGY